MWERLLNKVDLLLLHVMFVRCKIICGEGNEFCGVSCKILFHLIRSEIFALCVLCDCVMCYEFCIMYLSLSSVNHEQMSRKRKIRENVHLTKKTSYSVQDKSSSV